jgi:hypothetical protein
MEATDLLQFTSCVFSSVVMHAYFLQCALYHHKGAETPPQQTQQ